MATGKSFPIIGKATVKWKFEDKPHHAYIIDFDVVSNCVHDFILGKPFLKKTKCLSKYASQLVEMPPCLPGRNVLPINNIREVHQNLTVLARTPGRSCIFRMQSLPDTGSGGETMSEAYARKNNLGLEASDTKFLLPDRTLVDSVGRVRLDLSFEDEPRNRIHTFFEVMGDCHYEVIFGHNFIFRHHIFLENVHRLVNSIGRICLNAIIFLRKQKNAGMSSESPFTRG